MKTPHPPQGTNEQNKNPPRKAAMYVRMSTDHQKYSTENQSDAIKEYAVRYGIEIIQTYTDSGKSGLKLEGRDALKRLIDDVESGTAPFKVILVSSQAISS